VCPRAQGKPRDKTRALSSRETILYNVNCEFIKKTRPQQQHQQTLYMKVFPNHSLK